MLTALSLGARGGASFLPAGFLLGGAGGVGFTREVGVGRAVPLGAYPFAWAPAGVTAIGGAIGGAGFGSSLK